MSRSKRSIRAKALQNLKSLRTLAIARVEAAKDAVETAREAVIARTNSLEKVFEQRVSRAISRLGVPSAREVRELSRQVAQLKASVERLRRARA